MLNWLKHVMGDAATQKSSLLNQEYGQNTDVELENKQKKDLEATIAEMQQNKKEFAQFPALLGLIGNPGFAHEMRNLGRIISEYKSSLNVSSAEPDLAYVDKMKNNIAVSLRGLDMIVPSSAQSKEELKSTLELYLKAASQVGTGKALSEFDVTVGIYGQAVKEVVGEACFSPKPLK